MAVAAQLAVSQGAVSDDAADQSSFIKRNN